MKKLSSYELEKLSGGTFDCSSAWTALGVSFLSVGAMILTFRSPFSAAEVFCGFE